MQNEMRDRLVELLIDSEMGYAQYLCEECDKAIKGDVTKQLLKRLEFYADKLIANGVIVPHCKVGDTVWFNTFKKNATVCVGIQPHTVDRIDVICVCDTKNLVETNIRDWEFGKTVFLTKEEADRALKEGNNND